MLRRAFLGALAGAARRPNILFLLSDDQRADLLGCAGHPILQTPNIDRLAQSGTRFTNNFCATAICCTSRASIFTGLHEKSHGISNFRTPLNSTLQSISFPQLLRQAGYRTGFVGKFGVGGDAAPKDLFDVTHGNPGLERVGQSREFGKQAIDFLSSAKANEPFCLSVHFRAPHARDADPKQYLSDPEEANLYRDTNIPLPLKADPKYYDRLPENVRNSESRARWNKRFTNPAHYQESVKNYFRLISGVDAVTGDILRYLNQRGLEDSTVVIYSSDNGYFLAERGLADKWYLYEESIRTPLIIRDPRRPKSATRSEMTLNLDLSPTILSLAGIAVPPSVQGRSLVPLVEGRKPSWRREWFYSHLFPASPPAVTIPNSEGIRTTTHKYIRWTESKPILEEVYDLKRDPGELNPLPEGKAHRHLRNRWQRWNQALANWSSSTPWQDPQ